jgi:hypothetical protein
MAVSRQRQATHATPRKNTTANMSHTLKMAPPIPRRQDIQFGRNGTANNAFEVHSADARGKMSALSAPSPNRGSHVHRPTASS